MANVQHCLDQPKRGRSDERRVFFATTGFSCQSWEGDSWVERIRELAKRIEDPGFQLVDEPDQSDLIILFESVAYKERDYAKFLTEHPLVRNRGDRCVVYNYEDNPIAFLPGNYVSLPKERHDSNLHRPIGYLKPYNKICFEPQIPNVEPTFLFGFRGNPTSHIVRKEILKLKIHPEGNISDTLSWFDHGEHEKIAYRQDLLSSKFALCPRGLGTASHRLFEAMALGRSPVIISDQWARPLGPYWDSFAIFVAEADVSCIPELLKKHESEWEQRGRFARMAYEAFFAGSQAIRRLVAQSFEIQSARHTPITKLMSDWKSDAFYRPYGQGFIQKASRKIRSKLARAYKS